jgi:hypothetical protein
MLDRGASAEVGELAPDALSHAREALQSALQRTVGAWDDRERALEEARREQQRALVQAAGEFRRERVVKTLKRLESRGAHDFSLRMARSRVEKAEDRLRGALAALPSGQWRPAESQELAVGLVYVRGASQATES